MVTTTGMNGLADFNSEGEEINWWPGWGAFYWGARGRLWLIQDTTFSMDDFYADSDAYYADPTAIEYNDPCARNKALFGSNTGDGNRLNLDVTSNDSNVVFDNISYLLTDQETAANGDPNLWSTYKFAASTFSISWFWYIAVGQEELMTIKGRPGSLTVS